MKADRFKNPPAIKILRPGENVWRIEHANRAAVIIDAANHYGAVRAALLKAERLPTWMHTASPIICR